MTYAKKSLGQNFLRSKSALRAMVEAGKIREGEMVLEIGPGRGALTEKLLEAGASVVAVEKDEALIPILREKFAKEISEKRFFLIHADILDLSASDILKANKLTSSQADCQYPLLHHGCGNKKIFRGKEPA